MCSSSFLSQEDTAASTQKAPLLRRRPGPHCPSARAKLRLFCTAAGQRILRCSAYKKGERSTFRGRSGRIIPSSSTMIRVHCPAFTSTNSFY
ncbi:hypothetical protein C3706_07500 [Faecalibacterium prausnitzii]|uniref:Uncharacterized protein n=1 Tax=Faecalibacterium prausnitzii TaxID=853 RepID=A0AAX1QL62_9FIRM|nr:hypothetical protein C3706_07500 [Faecalibacterium prausnitzii]RAW51520.1 hypothetical protein C4N27_03270 [Faecalibacterium prausnitzii]